MNILKKIEDKTHQNEDLINNIDLNPIVSYHIIKEIVNSKINDINVIHKLIEISVKLSVNDSVLGPICLGHMSLAALRKLTEVYYQMDDESLGDPCFIPTNHEKEEYLDLVQKLEEFDYSLATYFRQLID